MKLANIRPRRLYYEFLWLQDAKKYAKIEKAIRKEFDPQFYLKTYPHVKHAGIEPIRHFIVEGEKKNYDPNPLFSTRRYVQAYPDVRKAGHNVFHHYMEYGREENRVGYVSDRSGIQVPRVSRKLAPPPAPSRAVWTGMTPRVVEGHAPTTIDVIVPVYKGLEHTAACLRSLLTARTDVPFECLVVDDCSPDPEIGELLEHLAGLGLVRLVENEHNLGFVATANRGMAVHPERDVVLLNSDAVVFDGWLDRIIARAAADPAIATATPLSNNATICSYPETAADNPNELEASAGEIAAMADRCNRSQPTVEIPTGVGFCMFIRRGALAALGAFDEETFGLGYGEENDFCMRALKAGWRNVLVPDAFVLHYGSVSFGEAQSTRALEAQRLLAARHPDYALRVQRHIEADPALPARIRLDAARLARDFAHGPADGRGADAGVGIVFVTHTRGGGIESYLDRLRAALLEEGRRDLVAASLVVRCVRGGSLLVEPFEEDAELPYLPNLAALNVGRHAPLLADVLSILNPRLVHVNSFAGLNRSEIEAFAGAIERAGAPVWHVWHDHQPLTPRVDFLDAEGRLVEEGDDAREAYEAVVTGDPLEWARPDAWRATFARYFGAVERVVAPTEAAADRARRIAPAERVVVEPHPEPDLAKVRPVRGGRRKRGEALRVGIVGAIGIHKGADLLTAMAIDADARGLPIRFELVGYSSSKALANNPLVTVHGKYEPDAEGIGLLRSVRPDVVFAASVWPETWLFTLSMAFALHLPVVAFDLGAQGERVGAYGRGHLLDAILREDPVAVNDALLGLDLERLWSAPATVSASRTTSIGALGRDGDPVRIAAPAPADDLVA